MQRTCKIDSTLALEIAAIGVAICWVDADLAAELAALDAAYAAEEQAMNQVEQKPTVVSAAPTIDTTASSSAIRLARELANVSIKNEKAFVVEVIRVCEKIVNGVEIVRGNRSASNLLVAAAKAVISANANPHHAAAIRAKLKAGAPVACNALMIGGADLDMVIPVANAISHQCDAAVALIADSHDWYRSGMTNTENNENNQIAAQEAKRGHDSAKENAMRRFGQR